MAGENDVLRIDLPDDAKLEKWDCDEYSTWDNSNRDYQLKDLNPKICVKINGRWNVLKDATKEWLNGTPMRKAISDSLQDLHPLFNIGYVTKEQFSWYYNMNNMKYSWRLDTIPSNLENVQIPLLTTSEIETLSYVKEMFGKYYEEVVDASFYYKDDEKEQSKENETNDFSQFMNPPEDPEEDLEVLF